MLIRYGFRLSIYVSQPTAVLARLDVHPSRRSDILDEAALRMGGVEAPAAITDLHGNLCRRLTVLPGENAFELSGLIEDSGTPEPQLSVRAGMVGQRSAR